MCGYWGAGAMHSCQGACMVAGGPEWLPWGMHGCWDACMVARGHAWLPVDMHGCRGTCMVAMGHAWLLGGMRGCQRVCLVGRGHAWLPVDMHSCWGARIGHNKVWSMSGWYSYYWNAFLLILTKLRKSKNQVMHKPKFKDPLSSTGLTLSQVGVTFYHWILLFILLFSCSIVCEKLDCFKVKYLPPCHETFKNNYHFL